MLGASCVARTTTTLTAERPPSAERGQRLTALGVFGVGASWRLDQLAACTSVRLGTVAAAAAAAAACCCCHVRVRAHNVIIV